MPYDRFIPFTKYDVINLCAQLLPEPESFKQFSHLLSSLIHHQYYTHLESL